MPTCLKASSTSDKKARHLVGLHLQHQIDELARGIALDIELGAEQGTQRVDIALADMPLVRTRMHRDAVRAKTLAVLRNFQYIRDIATPRIAQCGHLVDVHTQFSHNFML